MKNLIVVLAAFSLPAALAAPIEQFRDMLSDPQVIATVDTLKSEGHVDLLEIRQLEGEELVCAADLTGCSQFALRFRELSEDTSAARLIVTTTLSTQDKLVVHSVERKDVTKVEEPDEGMPSPEQPN